MKNRQESAINVPVCIQCLVKRNALSGIYSAWIAVVVIHHSMNRLVCVLNVFGTTGIIIRSNPPLLGILPDL